MKLIIAGFGLMGSSIARAARRAFGDAAIIYAVDPNDAVRTKAQELDLCTAAFADISDTPTDCDWMILAAPVSVNLSLIDTAITHAGEQTRITDLGSTKADIVRALETNFAEFDRFIPSHPMAGRELSGPAHGQADLFDNKRVILTPPTTADAAHISAATALFEQLGGHIIIMDDASEHDRLMGYASHLPHLLAFAFVNLAARGNNGARDYQDLTGAGYRDFTRIAASDPVMWQDIFIGNKDNILEQLDAFSAIADMYREAITTGDRAKLEALIGEAGDERKRLREIIKGQDT